MMSSEEESDINNSSYDLLYDSVGDNKPAVQLQQLLKKQQFGICNNIINNSSLLEKQRSRQRVDAGEPRNSYSSIPNFSSRSAAFMNGGLYGAIFSQHQNNSGATAAVQQQQQAANFGSLFGPNGYGPAKMLNDLLQGRTQMVKQENLMNSPNNLNNNIGNGSEQSLLSANNNSNNIIDGQATLKDSSENNSCNNNSVVTPNSLVNTSTMDSNAGLLLDEAAAHHMLRNILQGKKELQLAIDQELRKVSAQSGSGGGSERNSPDNNNTILNKNNNLTNNNNYDKSADNALTNTNSPNSVNNAAATENNNQSDVNSKSSENNNSSKNISNSKSNESDDKNAKSNADDANSNKENNNRDTNIPVPKQEQIDLNDEEMAINSIVDSDNSLDSPISNHATDGKDDIMDVDSDKGDNSPSPILSSSKPEIDLKRARVENIVSSMRASPSLGVSNQAQVNGCKKRKLYHPQQHDNTMMERYAAAVGLNLGLNFHNFMMNNSTGAGSGDDDDDDDVEPQDIHRKRVEKSMLKSQLKSMQDQLAEMQQKYMQLCTRMDQTSDTPDIDENSSDIVEDDMNNEALNKRTSPLTKLPMESPIKDMPPKSAPPTPNNLSQFMSKMMTAKIQGHLPPHLPPQFNGQIPLFQHLQQQQAMHDAAASMQQGGHENQASLHAAMCQKLEAIMEQHARRAKEVVEQRQQELMNQQREQQQQQQQQAQLNSISANAQNSMGPNVQNPGHNQQPNQPSPNQNQGAVGPQNPNVPPQLPKGASELAERYNMIRNNSIPKISGNDLEELAETLKQEIGTLLTNLVDTIVSRFMQQRKLLGKANEGAVAINEKFSKDYMLSLQLLDRKSPRTKVQDRSSSAGNAANNNQNSGNNGSNVSNNQAIMNNSPLSGNNNNPNNNNNINNQNGPPRMNGTVFPPHGMGMPSVHVNGPNPHDAPNLNVINNMPPHIRPPPAAAMFQPPKPPQGMSPVTAAALYNSMANLGNPNNPNPFCLPEPREPTREEQNEALSLVVTPKKKRHKVTDTRITPRTVSRILAQDGIGASTNHIASDNNSQNNGNKQFNTNQPTPTSQALSQVPPESPSPRQSYHPPTSSMLPSLPTSVAIPNPSLHESKVFSPYSPFFNPHGPQPSQLHHMHHMSASPPGGLGNMMDPRDSPPLPHPQSMLHPALLAAAHHGNSPDYSHMRAAMDANDRNSDCNSGDISYDGMQPTISFSKNQLLNNYLYKQTHQQMLKEQR